MSIISDSSGSKVLNDRKNQWLFTSPEAPPWSQARGRAPYVTPGGQVSAMGQPWPLSLWPNAGRKVQKEPVKRDVGRFWTV